MVLMRMPRFFSWAAVADGLRFQLPPAGLGMAVAVFGITGVGATELFMYPVLVRRKGLRAVHRAARRQRARWERRARGWIRVMHFDILVSMIIYTAATVAFYLLGAGVLHGMGLVPASADMIPVLSNLYTQTLGGWALGVFYVGAIATLYGTVFAATAAHSRMFADMCRLAGRFEADDLPRRARASGTASSFCSGSCRSRCSSRSQSPVTMVMIGGIVQALMLPVIGIGAISCATAGSRPRSPLGADDGRAVGLDRP